MLNQILVDSLPRNYFGSFVLIKPSQPFYKEGEDYQILSFPNNEVIAKSRLVYKHTYPLNEIPDMYSLLYKDITARDLIMHLRNVSTATQWDVLHFSSNAHYNEWYKDRKVEATNMRQNEINQLSLF